MADNRRNLFWGWVLLLLGAFLLLDHRFPHLFGWYTILIGLGVALFVQGLARNKGAVFPGTFLFLLGLFFLLEQTEVIYLPGWQNWPLIVLFLGVSFVVLYVFDPNRRGALLTGTIIIAGAFIFLRYPHGRDEILEWLGHWWPLILILIGLRIIWKTSVRQKS